MSSRERSSDGGRMMNVPSSCLTNSCGTRRRRANRSGFRCRNSSALCCRTTRTATKDRAGDRTTSANTRRMETAIGSGDWKGRLFPSLFPFAFSIRSFHSPFPLAVSTNPRTLAERSRLLGCSLGQQERAHGKSIHSSLIAMPYRRDGCRLRHRRRARANHDSNQVRACSRHRYRHRRLQGHSIRRPSHGRPSMASTRRTRTVDHRARRLAVRTALSSAPDLCPSRRWGGIGIARAGFIHGVQRGLSFAQCVDPVDPSKITRRATSGHGVVSRWWIHHR